MVNVRIGIVEDDALIAESIGQLLLNLGYDVLEPVASYIDAVKLIEQHRPDFMILDIRLGEGKTEGIRLAELINQKYLIPFIFLTANADKLTVDKAKATAPKAFLVKPFTKADLYATIEVAISKHSAIATYNTIPFLFLKVGDRFKKVFETDIVYIESNHVYLDIHTKTEKIVIRSTVDEFLKQLSSHRFCKISRSYIVNLYYVDSFNNESVWIKDKVFPLSKSHQQTLISNMQGLTGSN
ncbi:MAG: DNA-binding response regulator [Bacteroidetes bacterium]|nr:MAG: DNA-binding response regulator [Bacteroidota bacterium]TAE71628.1 MAG: DNA-binding response regulator [Bacteroidota bacterium]TAF93542.1 MAG: DNA-binding response regulator [Bacteroidota bacterium]